MTLRTPSPSLPIFNFQLPVPCPVHYRPTHLEILAEAHARDVARTGQIKRAYLRHTYVPRAASFAFAVHISSLLISFSPRLPPFAPLLPFSGLFPFPFRRQPVFPLPSSAILLTCSFSSMPPIGLPPSTIFTSAAPPRTTSIFIVITNLIKFRVSTSHLRLC